MSACRFPTGGRTRRVQAPIGSCFLANRNITGSRLIMWSALERAACTSEASEVSSLSHACASCGLVLLYSVDNEPGVNDERYMTNASALF